LYNSSLFAANETSNLASAIPTKSIKGIQGKAIKAILQAKMNPMINAITKADKAWINTPAIVFKAQYLQKEYCLE
jgi:hypothetical protein